MIKINTMMRTQEDEKSKAAQLQEKNEKQVKEITDLTVQRDEAKESFKKEFEQNEAMGKANSELKRTQEQVELNNLKLRQEQQKTERIANDLASQNEEKQKSLDMATMKMNEMERAKRKIQRECVGLENDKTRVTSEKNEAIAEKESAKGYMNNLFRDFNWLKKKTDEEQAGIMKLERDRNMLKTALIKMEKNNEENRNNLMRKEQIIATLQD